MKIKYESNIKETKIVLTELSRAAFREVAKLIRNDAKNRVKMQSEDTGNLRKSIATWVKRKGSEGPHLQIGVYDKKRAEHKGLKDPYYAHFIEFGTKKMAARPFLRPSVHENIDEIRRIEGKYFKEIENENRARGLIDEAEEIKDD